jgi:hypothetical protein
VIGEIGEKSGLLLLLNWKQIKCHKTARLACDVGRLPAHALVSLTQPLEYGILTYQLQTKWNIIIVGLWKGCGKEQLSLACTADPFTKYQKFCGPLPRFISTRGPPMAILLGTITNKK